MTGKPRSIELIRTRDYLQQGSDHLEFRSIKPRNAPHPLSPTGYLSHFVLAAELKAAGGAVRFAQDWLAREAKSKDFVAAEQRRLQGDLFTWADRRPSRPAPSKAGRTRPARPSR